MTPPPEVVWATLAQINALALLAEHDGFREMRGDETLEQYERELAAHIEQASRG